MGVSADAKGVGDAQKRAHALVRFWHSRQWLSTPAPLHVHPLDLVKLEELITAAITDPDSVNFSFSP